MQRLILSLNTSSIKISHHLNSSPTQILNAVDWNVGHMCFAALLTLVEDRLRILEHANQTLSKRKGQNNAAPAWRGSRS